MPFSTYRADRIGRIEALTPGQVTAGEHTTLRFRFTAGEFGIDDTGGLKISWRQTSDMGRPQTTDPTGAGFTRIVEAPGQVFDMSFGRNNFRPWSNTLHIRVGRFLRPGDQFELIIGCRDAGGPGIRMQTNAENAFTLKTFVDAFATYDFVELPESPLLDVVPGRAETYRLVLPIETRARTEDVPLRTIALDRWGNPTLDGPSDLTLTVDSGADVKTQPFVSAPDDLVTQQMLPAPALDQELRVSLNAADGSVLGLSNPCLGVPDPQGYRLWADLHGQSGETVGSGTLAEYFAFADGPGLLDATCHQGNDFQMTDANWAEVNRLSALHDVPGSFVALPGYEWSGNTGVGGDHNVIYAHEGEPILRSSCVLLPEDSMDEAAECPKIDDLFAALDPARSAVIAHVGGRYAMIRPEDDLRLQRAVEVHSCWGTFEWILHDSFEAGHRIGIVAHSDDHKGRPGCAWPGASTFGALGGLTCYKTESFDRTGILDALRRRATVATTGNRVRLELEGQLNGGSALVHVESDRSDTPVEQDTLQIGAIARTGAKSLTLSFDIGCPGPISGLDLFDGTERVDGWEHPLDAPAPDDRIRVLGEGALYRGRGRHVVWDLDVTVDDARITSVAPINVFNRDKHPQLASDGARATITTVTTGNRSGIDLLLADATAGALSVSTDLGELNVDLAKLGFEPVALDGEGLERRVTVQRRPARMSVCRARGTFDIPLVAGREHRLYLRVRQDDGHVAWSSPIYLEALGGKSV